MNSNEPNNKQNKSIAVLILSILMLILLIVMVGIAYAKFTSSASGTATAQVAKMICNMNVTPSAANSTVINPYCTVTLTNFNNSTDISQADLNYTVQVSLNGNSTLESLPEYYWEDSGGNVIANSTSQPLTGSFKKGTQDTQTYKVVFVNAGTNTITGMFDFDLVAVQQSNE